MLLNVAGVMAAKESDNFATVNKEILTKTFETNTFGPLLLSQALLENLLAAENAKIGIVSSRVGSIGDNSTGGSYAYRASKAAVNSVGKSMAVDLQSQAVVVTLLHPGIVNSGMNPDPAEGVEPDVAAAQMVCTPCMALYPIYRLSKLTYSEVGCIPEQRHCGHGQILASGGLRASLVE